MRIAVSYENGRVFPHFGKTAQFKIYETQEGRILSAAVVSTDGAGHEALAEFLANKGVEVVLCGGCGQGAVKALAEARIEVISGAEGEADTAVEEYLAGSLKSAGVNCDHHHEEQEGEEGGCGHCGGSCGHCGGGCHERPLLYEGPNAGKTVRVHYKGTFNDGFTFDSSYDRNEPLEFVCATGMMIPGFDQAVVNMKVGETLDIHLTPDQAYGEKDPDAVFTLQIAELPGSEGLNVGQHVYLENAMGQPFPVCVTAKTATTITFDANHEMAGKELNFHIELVEVVD